VTDVLHSRSDPLRHRDRRHGLPAALAEAAMIAGHFGFAAAVKAKAPRVPLWTLMLASQWLDVIFVPLLLGGVEHIQSIPGAKEGAYGSAIIHADYTHSLVGAIVLAAIFGGVAAIRYRARGGTILGLVVMSHWLLDLPMHRADLPILPGNAGDLPRLGFGLWNSPVASAIVELLLVVAGAVLYWRAAREVAGGDARHLSWSNVCGASVLIAGLLTLALNVLGM
jgi:hypothetical protein